MTSWILLLGIVIIPLIFLRRWLSLRHDLQSAARLGARPIPVVKGKWPLNFDVVLSWTRWSQDEVGRMLFELEKKYGTTFNTRTLGEDQIISSDPIVLRHVFMTGFDNFVKGPKFHTRTRGYLGDGIFNTDGSTWHSHRTTLRPFFRAERIRPELFEPIIDKFLLSLPTAASLTPDHPVPHKDIITASPPFTMPNEHSASLADSKTTFNGNTTKAFDMQALLGRLTLQIALLWLTGEDISSNLSDNDNSSVLPRAPEWRQALSELPTALKQAQEIVAFRLKIGWPWRLLELGRSPLRKPMKTVHAFFRPLIDEAYLRQSGTSLLDALVHQEGMSKEKVQDQLINVLLAARDTTTVLLTCCTYLSLLQPHLQDVLCEEIRQYDKRHSFDHSQDEDSEYKNEHDTGDNQGSTRHLDYSENHESEMGYSREGYVEEVKMTRTALKELTKCRAFIDETLRLFPPVPINVRRAVNDCVIPTSQGPMFMKGGTTIILCPLLMQRSSDYWEDPLDFKLDRWARPEETNPSSVQNPASKPTHMQRDVVEKQSKNQRKETDGNVNREKRQKEEQSYMPWNVGPRTCLGQNMAIAVSMTFLVKWIRYLHRMKEEGVELVLAESPTALRTGKGGEDDGDGKIPGWWFIHGAGRLRDGRDKVWMTSNMTLNVKVSSSASPPYFL
ncbi:hypothetical protein TREMEDRAFT_72868 [Tremella mesenterica DSM 1558]|uniref:uncharacterized protein n=1 Tax=Tremella mesenterica (strain ATCC 24925 / CBS 8224 / DSM 1558 / NBRC 9311 / NRRL Y-6157 / RJB 2259-6 / UBC 559-6) TaxID=578456 RepID=UPI0003F4925E|nr:uncharacterized protein TREMEDRAFT_72868 [Tremella mesenterica DSM 1558]EIW72761.1 hypothetical protein TREMEDRAFT_72868 [Tremella mesenterica DSM 1558]